MLNRASLFKKSYMKKVVLSIGDCFWYFQDEYILVFCIVESATEQLSFSYVHCVFVRCISRYIFRVSCLFGYFT